MELAFILSLYAFWFCAGLYAILGVVKHFFP